MNKKKNYFGNFLLEFCKCNDMFILNGRIGKDKGVGKLLVAILVLQITFVRNMFICL